MLIQVILLKITRITELLKASLYGTVLSNTTILVLMVIFLCIHCDSFIVHASDKELLKVIYCQIIF